MRLVMLMLCSLTLAGCDAGKTDGTSGSERPSVGPKATGTGAPGSDRSAQPAQRPKRAPAPTTLLTAEPVASAAASGAASAAASTADNLLRQIAKTRRIKVIRISNDGESQHGILASKEVVRPLLDAIGLKQTPTDDCAECMPSITFTFEDDFGTRLASIGAFCTEGGVKRPTAMLRDPLGNRCQTISLANPKVVETLADQGISNTITRRSRR